MATVETPISTRIRHPLQAVRKYIRSYVLQEGIATAIVYLAAAFWIGLFLDYGVFLLFHYDWILELNFTDENGQASLAVRIVTMLLVLAGLGVTLYRKVIRRMFTDFSDASIALVLERRFPRELGDRLITAVELADPNIGPKFGYSSAFIALTIEEADEKVSRLPVARVFDWTRLRWMWVYSLLMTIGVFLLVSAISIAVSMGLGWISSPGAYFGKFVQTSTIWLERNLALQNSYWPRNSLIELIRFQDSDKHPGEMRIGRDEARPDITVRAVKWAVADSKIVGGWRSLRVSDLPRFLPSDVLAGVNVPADSPAWIVDLDDLDRSVPNGVFPLAWQGKSAGEVRSALAGDNRLAEEIAQAKVGPALAALLDWRQWTVDQIEIQLAEKRVRTALGEEQAKALQNVLAKVDEVASQTAMSRSLRQLVIPTEVSTVFRGETTKSEMTAKQFAEHKYLMPLKDLTESATFYVRGNDAFTPTRSIVLAPPPVVIKMLIDKEEPAYVYHRVQGDQAILKGKRQIFRNYEVSVTGDLTTIDVPMGSSLVLTGKVDRPIKETLLVKMEAGVVPNQVAGAPSLFVREKDATGFRAEFRRVDRAMPMVVTFFDEDNVRGERRIRIRPIEDLPPEVLAFEPGAELRKPRFQDPNKAIGIPSDGLLITPDAAIPFNGVIRDDIGLTRGDWAIEVEQAEFELASKSVGKEEKKKEIAAVSMVGSARVRRAAINAGLARFNPTLPLAAAVEAAWTNRLLELDSKRGGLEESIPIAGVMQRLQGIPEIPLPALDALLVEKPSPKVHLKEYNLRGEEVFDLRKQLPKLKSREAQLHYVLKISLLAADNNVETGPGIGRSKTPVTFLVVSENELLAQIAIEEELLREKLEKQQQKMKTALITLEEQIAKLSTSGDPSLVLIRIDEVRKAVLDGTSGTREVHSGCARILRELEINRARSEKLSEMQTKIVNPLAQIVNPREGGYFFDLDASVQRLYEKLDDDINTKRIDLNRDQNQQLARTAKKDMEETIQQLDRVLAAMEEGIVFSKLVEIAVEIEKGNRGAMELLERQKKDVTERIFDEILNPKK